jgi:chemotaxis protein CheD
MIGAASASKLVVGVADLKTSANPEDVVITYALGSCLGIIAHDPVARVGGLVHVMTPSSTLDPLRALRAPATYVDSGVNLLIDECLRLGAQKSRIVLVAAGGAERGDGKSDMFQIGRRNFVALRQVLWKLGIILRRHDVGGNKPRTMSLAIGSGEVSIIATGNVAQRPAA